MRARIFDVVLTLALGAAIAMPADGSPASRVSTRAAYALAYDLQFVACYATLAEAVELDPRDPAPRRAIAAVTWMEILFAQGVATFEAFTGEISKGDVSRPDAPPMLAERFRRAIGEARELSNEQLAQSDDADAHYQAGATAVLLSLYTATVEGRTVGAIGQGRRAVREMERARARGNREAALVLGMSQYTISAMSWPMRTLARLSGLSGNRGAGVALLNEAAAPGMDTEPDALLLLMIIDNREGAPANGLEPLAQLERLYPRNRLLRLNHGATALSAGRAVEADQVLSPSVAAQDWGDVPVVLGERALWFLHRGTARAGLGRRAEAVDDLQRGLQSASRDWVRSRIHDRLGDLASAAGEPALARREFEAALDFAERGGDPAVARAARQKLQRLGTLQAGRGGR